MKNIFTIKFRVISDNSINTDREWKYNIGGGGGKRTGKGEKRLRVMESNHQLPHSK